MRQKLILSGGSVLRAGTRQPERLDILIDGDGRIAALEKVIAAEDARTVALDGQFVVPGLVDIHQHVDKSRTRSAVSNPSGTLRGASAGYAAFSAGVTREDIIARAERTLAACAERGTVAIRSHTNIEPETGLRGIEAMLEVRERWRERMTLQIVAHVTAGATRSLADAEIYLKGAIAAGVDALGGVPAYAAEPLAFLDLLFRLAESSGLPIDLHLDEHLDPNNVLFDALAERTRAHAMQGRVVAGHCSALSALPVDLANRIADDFAAAGIGVVTLPAANLFLQGREATTLSPRGLTRARELSQRGVQVAAGSDNIQDPFVPTGTGDLLEIARWTLLAGHLGLSDLGRAFDMVSSVPAGLMGLRDDWGIEVGRRADLLITKAIDVDDLVASGPLKRTVLVGGREVAERF
ncbi:amidohydrolase family protein [soil metagenome]